MWLSENEFSTSCRKILLTKIEGRVTYFACEQTTKLVFNGFIVYRRSKSNKISEILTQIFFIFQNNCLPQKHVTKSHFSKLSPPPNLKIRYCQRWPHSTVWCKSTAKRICIGKKLPNMLHQLRVVLKNIATTF